MKGSPIKLKQKLSPKAAAAKKRRDIAAAKTPVRKARKAQNQRLGQRSNSDIHHRSDGSVARVSIKNNRGNFGNKPSMSKLAGVSPMKDNGNDEAKKQKIKEIEANIAKIKADMSAGKINKVAAMGTLQKLTEQLMKLTGGKVPN